MTERPVECGCCKKKIGVIYKEIAQDEITLTEMCADCPVLKQKMGAVIIDQKQGAVTLLCGLCKTALEQVQRGEPLGCPECYSTFSQFLILELIARGDLPPRLVKTLARKKSSPLHAGKAPKTAPSISLSSEILALNEALQTALKRENYERAAWLRDQIQSLKEKPHDIQE